MTPAASPKPRSPAVRGLWTLLTSTVTIVIVLVGNLLIQPRLSERHLRIDDRYILTPEEVALLPPETLAVVLDRTPGQDQRGFRYRLLQLVLERSGRSFALGLSQQIQSQDEAIAALEQGNTSSRNPFAISVGAQPSPAGDSDSRHRWNSWPQSRMEPPQPARAACCGRFHRRSAQPCAASGAGLE